MAEGIPVEYSVRTKKLNLNTDLNLLTRKVPAPEILGVDLESEEENTIIFLSRAEYVYELIHDGIELEFQTLTALPFVSQFTVSNVYPFITNSFLCELFNKFGTVLKIESVCISSENFIFNHIMSGRRRVTYLLPSNDLNITVPKQVPTTIGDLFLLFPVEKYCCACGNDGHSMLECAELHNWYKVKRTVDCKYMYKDLDVQMKNDCFSTRRDLHCFNKDSSAVNGAYDFARNLKNASCRCRQQNLKKSSNSNGRRKRSAGCSTIFKIPHNYKFFQLLNEDCYSVTKHASKIISKYKQIRTFMKLNDSNRNAKPCSKDATEESLKNENDKTNAIHCNESDTMDCLDTTEEIHFLETAFMPTKNNENETISNCNDSLNDSNSNAKPCSKDATEESLKNENDKTNAILCNESDTMDCLDTTEKMHFLETVFMPIKNNENETISNCNNSLNSSDMTKNLFYDDEDSDSSSSLPSLTKLLNSFSTKN